MSAAEEMPLLEMLQVLSRTPVSEPQLRAVVAVTCARWCVARGEDGEAQRLLTHALELVPDLDVVHPFTAGFALGIVTFSAIVVAASVG